MDKFDRTWITENAVEICDRYDHGVMNFDDNNDDDDEQE